MAIIEQTISIKVLYDDEATNHKSMHHVAVERIEDELGSGVLEIEHGFKERHITFEDYMRGDESI